MKATLLWLWRAGSRFGPVIPLITLSRRSVAEHIRAVGEFLWRHQQQHLLWRATLRVAQRRVARLMPPSVDGSADIDALAVRTGVDSDAIRRVLGDSVGATDLTPPSRQQFQNSIATLEQIRKSL